MTATDLVLTVLATVVAIDGGSATIDRGLIAGLRPGDMGRNHYELRVSGATHRIDVGQLELAAVEARSSRLAIPGEVDVKVGSLVEFQVPADRISDRNVIAAAREHLDAEGAESIVAGILDDMVADDDPALREELKRRLGVGAPEADGAPPATPRSDPLAGMIRVPAGRYTIGADPQEAEYFNEQPAFRARIEAFWIDRSAIAPEPDARTYAEAEADCAERGKRLPSELEWETAARYAAIEHGSFYEWTSSWYQAYPGNSVREDEYGRKNRVLRGEEETDALRPARRRFMDPGLESSLVGFRCARSEERSAS